MISVLVVEDQAAVREAFAAMLGLQDDIRVAGLAANCREAIDMSWIYTPDVALVDVQMPDGNGLKVVEHLAASAPDCRCIILTTFNRPGYIDRASTLGAWAFLAKTLPFVEIIDAIRRVHAGERLISQQPGSRHSACPLSEREVQLLRVALRLSTTAKIADAMHLSQGTVNNYLSLIMTKLNVANRAQAVMVAQTNGWL